LLVIGISPHIIHFLCLGAVRKYFQVAFEQVLGIHIITHIISAISVLIINVLELFPGLVKRHYIFVDLLRQAVLLFYKILLGHPQFIFIVGVLQEFPDIITATAENKGRDKDPRISHKRCAKLTDNGKFYVKKISLQRGAVKVLVNRAPDVSAGAPDV
jgi:hypothetical protein